MAGPKSKTKSQPLNGRQRRFVDEYLIDLNGRRAAERAGYSEKSAADAAKMLLANPDVAEAIADAKKRRTKRTEVTADRVVKELARIAFFDIGELYHEDGGLKAFHEMSEDARRAVASCEVEMLSVDGESVGTIRKLKMVDKLGALNTLAKHTGVDPNKVKLGVDTDDPLAALIASIQGSAIKPVSKPARDGC